MKIVRLTNDLVPFFDEYLKHDILLNAIWLRDLHVPYLRKHSEFYLALENGRLIGSLLSFHHRLQLRREFFPAIWILGKGKVVYELLKLVKIRRRAIFHVLPENSNLIEEMFPEAIKVPIDCMILERGNENVIIYHLVKKIRRGSYLRERTRLLDARLTRKSLEELKKREKASGNQPYCAFVDKKIVSITHLAPVVNGVWLIGWTFTKREYRNRGFATSVVSYAVRDVIERRNAKRIVLFVIRENFPAKRVYEKVGFRRYKEMVWFDLNTGLLRVENDA